MSWNHFITNRVNQYPQILLDEDEDNLGSRNFGLGEEDDIEEIADSRLEEELKKLEDFDFEKDEEEESDHLRTRSEQGKIEILKKGISEYRLKCKQFDFLTFPIETVVSKFEENNVDLVLSHLFLGDQGMEALGELLKVNQTIQTLVLDDNNISPLGFRFIVESIKFNLSSKVEIISLQNNQLGEKREQYRFGPLFIELIESKPKALTTINLRGNQLSDPDVIDIARILEKEGSVIQKIDLSYNNIGYASSTSLRKLFENNVNITEVSFEWNSFNQSSMLELIQGLKDNNTLKKLNLSWCGINDIGALEISKMLLGNTKLEVLDLKQNRIGLNGALAISKALKENDSTALISLNISNNPIMFPGALSFLQNVQKNDSIQEIVMSNVDIGEKYQEVIKEVQKRILILKKERSEEELIPIRKIEQEVLIEYSERFSWKKRLIDPMVKIRAARKLAEEEARRKKEEEESKGGGKSVSARKTPKKKGKKKRGRSSRNRKKKEMEKEIEPYYILV